MESSATEVERQVGLIEIMASHAPTSWALAAIVGIGFVTRLLWVVAIERDPQLAGGDGPFYIEVAQSFANGTGLSTCDSLDCLDASGRRAPIVTVGPLYPLFLGSFYFAFHNPDVAFQASRVADVLVATATMLVLWWLVAMLWGPIAALVAATILAVDLRFIVEIGNAHTEPLFTLFLVGAVGGMVWANAKNRPRVWIVPGLLVGLASLTRPAAILLTVAGLGHLLVTRTRGDAFKAGLWFIIAFALTMSPWVVRNYLVFGDLRFSEGVASHFWLGAQGDGQWQGQEPYHESIAQLPHADGENPTDETYLRAGLKSVFSSPARYVGLLAAKLMRSYVQPSGTVVLGGESIKDATLAWLAGERQLRDVLAIREFWPKLYMYVFHFGSIGLALAAVVKHRKRWRRWLLPALVIVFFSAAYTLLTIIPRYLFPIMPLYVVLAALLVPERSGART